MPGILEEKKKKAFECVIKGPSCGLKTNCTWMLLASVRLPTDSIGEREIGECRQIHTNMQSWQIQTHNFTQSDKRRHTHTHTHTQTPPQTYRVGKSGEVMRPPFCLPCTLPLLGIIAAWLLVWESELLRSLVALNIRHGITFKGLISLQSQPFSLILARGEPWNMLLFSQAWPK